VNKRGRQQLRVGLQDCVVAVVVGTVMVAMPGPAAAICLFLAAAYLAVRLWECFTAS
jgi:hypothetical protein